MFSFGLNYLFVTFLIIFALYGLWKEQPPYYQHLMLVVVGLALIYNLITIREGFKNGISEAYKDFSRQPRASLDVFCWRKKSLEDPNSEKYFVCNDYDTDGTNNTNRQDRCKHCDGLCTKGAVGQNFSPGAHPLCRHHPLIKNGDGYYRIQSIDFPKKYLAYDLQGMGGNSFLLYLGKPNSKKELEMPDLVWKIERELDNFHISTCNQPTMYLDGDARGNLSLSYFKPAGQWKLMQRNNGDILIKLNHPNLYLTSNGD